MTPIVTTKELLSVIDWDRKADATLVVESRVGDADDLPGGRDENGRATLARNDRERHFESVISYRRQASAV